MSIIYKNNERFDVDTLWFHKIVCFQLFLYNVQISFLAVYIANELKMFLVKKFVHFYIYPSLIFTCVRQYH